MHFSVASDKICTGQYELQVCCSTFLKYCFAAQAGLKLAHDPEKTRFRKVRLSSSGEIFARLRTTDESILQCFSYLDNEAKEGALDASFTIQHFPDRSSEEQPLAIEDKGENFSWIVELRPGAEVGKGILEVCGDYNAQPIHFQITSETVSYVACTSNNVLLDVILNTLKCIAS